MLYEVITGHLILDLVEETNGNLKTAGITTLDGVRSHPGNLVGFSPRVAEQNRALKKFLREKLYHHYKVERVITSYSIHYTKLYE